MPNRILKDTINTSRDLTACSFFVQDLYKRLITYADDYGNFPADPTLVRAGLYPREMEAVDEDLVLCGLIELAGADKLAFYLPEEGCELYGRFPGWGRHQRLRNSRRRYPEPLSLAPTRWLAEQAVRPEAQRECLDRQAGLCADCGRPLNPWDLPQTRLLKLGPLALRFGAEEGRAVCRCPACGQGREGAFTELTLKAQALRASLAELQGPEDPAQPPGDPESSVLPESLEAVRRASLALGLPWTARDGDRAAELCQRHGAVSVLAAVERAGLRERSKLSWGYVRGILERWEAQGYVDEPGQEAERAYHAQAF